MKTIRLKLPDAFFNFARYYAQENEKDCGYMDDPETGKSCFYIILLKEWLANDGAGKRSEKQMFLLEHTNEE